MPILLLVVTCVIAIFGVLDSNYGFKTDSIEIKYEDLLPSYKKQVDCLAQNIYFEAGREPYEGKVGVAMVTLHRVNAGPWPNTVCGVVREKNASVCQFSWWCEVKNKQKALSGKYTHQERKLYSKAQEVALHVYMNYDYLKKHDVTKGSYFYHAKYVSPGWKYKKTTELGQHIFYTKNL